MLHSGSLLAQIGFESLFQQQFTSHLNSRFSVVHSSGQAILVFSDFPLKRVRRKREETNTAENEPLKVLVKRVSTLSLPAVVVDLRRRHRLGAVRRANGDFGLQGRRGGARVTTYGRPWKQAKLDLTPS